MPASPKQIAANRRNAQKSTGPKTEAGNERSRANAPTHGLPAAPTLCRPIRHEDVAQFAERRGKLLTDWNPVGTKEEVCVEMIAAAYNRIKRADAWATAFFDGAMDATQLSHGKAPEATSHDDLGCGLVLGQKSNRLSWENLDRYRRAAWLDYNRAVEQLRRLQKDRLDAEFRELRLHKMRDEYYRRTHVAHGSAVPATKMASFRPEPINIATGRPEPADTRPPEPPSTTRDLDSPCRSSNS